MANKIIEDQVEIKNEDQNFMAEMVEVRLKMFACRVCGIRYDNMDSMKQHYNEVHPTSPAVDEESSAKIAIKEEIIDEDEDQPTISSGDNYVLVDDNVHLQLGEGLQVLQFSNAGENSQILFQVLNASDEVPQEGEEEIMEHTETDEHPIGEIVERRRTRQQTAAAVANNISNAGPTATSRRGRKRKATLESKTQASSRPKRTLVPNIKSEFIYDGISQSIESEGETKQDNTGYTFIQEGGVITAFQVTNEVETTDKEKVVVEQNVTEEESYPPDYTPTSKTKKGRQIEPKEDDQYLRRFPCPFQGCKYVAKYRSNLWDHKKTHTGEKPYACNWPSCSMRFSQTHQLKLHLRSHTGERPYVCDWPGCNSAFSQKPGLKSHMLTHTGEKPFKCDFPGCGWTFRLKGALTDHKRAIHENAKKHICEWPGCNKRFLQQCHLKKHIMGHADIKPFACDWPNCNYKAVTMAYVTNHRKTHTGEKNYECTYPNCNKRFVKSSHVNRHRQRCHPELFVVLQEDVDVNANESEGEDTDGAVASIQPSGSTRKRSNTRTGLMTYKLTNQNGEEDEEEGIYLQQEEVEEEEIDANEENVRYINGSTMVTGQHFIIADNSSDGQLMIELKKEKIEEDEIIDKN